MRSSTTALAFSLSLATTALAASLSLPVNLHLDLETSLLSLKLDPTVDPSLNLTDLIAAGKINVLSSPVDTSSTQNGAGDSVTRGGRQRRAISLSPDVSPDVNLADLVDLSTINVLASPVDTHSEQNGAGDSVVRGGRRAKRASSLLDLDLSPTISPDIALSDLLNLSTINVLSSPVDTSSVQNGDGDTVTRGGRKRASASVSPDVSPTIDLSSLLNLDKINLLAAPVDTHSVQNGDGETVTRGGRQRRSIDLSPNVSPDLDLTDLVDASTINVLASPVDTHSVQNGAGDSVVRGGRMAKREPSLIDLNASPDVSPDVDLSDLIDLDTINVLSSPVDTSSTQNGAGDTVSRGGRRA